MGDTYITKNFTIEELQCKCGCKRLPEESFIHKLQMLRLKCGFPFVISSGFRCSAYNATLLGAHPESAHTKGLAVDIDNSNIDSDRLWHLMKYATELDFNGIEISTAHIHLDMKDRGHKKMWINLN